MSGDRAALDAIFRAERRGTFGRGRGRYPPLFVLAAPAAVGSPRAAAEEAARDARPGEVGIALARTDGGPVAVLTLDGLRRLLRVA